MVFRKSRKKHEGKVLKKNWFAGFFPVELFNRMKRQQIISPGSLLIFLLLIVPIGIWLSYTPDSLQNPLIGLAKFNAFMAISTLSLNFLLAARLKILEKVFNGLDRMYRVHKVIGRLSLFFILLHPLFLMVSHYPNLERILPLVIPIGSVEVSAGVISVYLFLLLLTLTVAIKIPYHLWHISHKLLGIVLILAAYHAVVAGSDINSYPLLRYWVLFISGIGIISWVYMLILYRLIGPCYKVVIEEVKRLNDFTEVFFKKPKGFNFQPGQFIFISFPRFKGVHELFPFSLSSDPSKKHVRLSIKKSGDFTSENIPKLQKGDTAKIMGPYGTFGESYFNKNTDMIWIAGGIGITPFLSIAKHESLFPSGHKIFLIWTVNKKEDAIYDKELIEETKKNSNFHYIHWISNEKGYLDSEKLLKLIDGKVNLKKSYILMCGPPPMMYMLTKGFHNMHIPSHRIIFEDFNMLD